jgi:hypothetical protein
MKLCSMSIIDSVVNAAKDMMDDGQLNGSTGGGSPMGDVTSMITSQLGGDHMAMLTEKLGGAGIKPADLMSKLPMDQVGNLVGMVQGGKWDELVTMAKGLVGM